MIWFALAWLVCGLASFCTILVSRSDGYYGEPVFSVLRRQSLSILYGIPGLLILIWFVILEKGRD